MRTPVCTNLSYQICAAFEPRDAALPAVLQPRFSYLNDTWRLGVDPTVTLVGLPRPGDVRTLHAPQLPSVPEELLAHLAPVGWQHTNLTGDYFWDPDANTRPDCFRPPRATIAQTLYYSARRSVPASCRQPCFCARPMASPRLTTGSPE
jgi:hypothetical protein